MHLCKKTENFTLHKTVQPTALKQSLVKTTEFELEFDLVWLKCGCVEKLQIFL